MVVTYTDSYFTENLNFYINVCTPGAPHTRIPIVLATFSALEPENHKIIPGRFFSFWSIHSKILFLITYKIKTMLASYLWTDYWSEGLLCGGGGGGGEWGSETAHCWLLVRLVETVSGKLWPTGSASRRGMQWAKRSSDRDSVCQEQGQWRKRYLYQLPFLPSTLLLWQNTDINKNKTETLLFQFCVVVCIVLIITETLLSFYYASHVRVGFSKRIWSREELHLQQQFTDLSKQNGAKIFHFDNSYKKQTKINKITQLMRTDTTHDREEIVCKMWLDSRLGPTRSSTRSFRSKGA